MLRLARECDLFRKLPTEHREAELPEGGATAILRAIVAALIALLTLTETWTFVTPVPKQRFDLDMGESVDVSAPRKIRVELNVTVIDFPCVDLSLDYQDVMGTRAVDVQTTVFKRRLHKNGTAVGETEQNSPKTAVKGGPTNPSIFKNNTGNKTCGTCYGALPDGECCNTCSDVLYAYRVKRWALPRIEEIEQCKHDGSARSAYQPPQIIRLNDYSSEDYLPKFTKIGSLSPSGSEARITTPFRLNLSLEPLKPLNFTFGGRTFQPLVLNFSSTAAKGTPFNDDLDGFDDAYDGEEDDDLWADGVDGGTNSSKRAKGKAQLWPECVQRNVIIHGYDAGEALRVDLEPHGAKTGCWHGNCRETDQFDCGSLERCAGVCGKVPSCHWWTFGAEDGSTSKCWLRTGRHGRGKRYGFSSGPRSCAPPANATEANATGTNAAAVIATATKAPVAATEGRAHPRRLVSFEDDIGSFSGKPFTFNFGPALHMPMFGLESKEAERRRQQRGESCQIYGYFDTNKVPGNFHIGTHGATTPSYLSFFDEPSPPSQNMRHVINRLAFVDVSTGTTLNETQPLDGFDSPKAFTFQYYLTITPATLVARDASMISGYQFRAGSFVTNELIGPAVFFRMDIDPIRVTYYTEEVRWSSFLVNICAVIGGCIAVGSMLAQFMETASACATNRD